MERGWGKGGEESESEGRETTEFGVEFQSPQCSDPSQGLCSVPGHVSHTQREDQIALEMWVSPRRISLRTQSLLLRGFLRPEVPGVSPSLGGIAATVTPVRWKPRR